ncbi:MAG: GspH/FimT family pseudopilin [Methylococcaceae bacterium]|nr:GspH/FimT family pseudopilin [Methylococcaceae bacterium]
MPTDKKTECKGFTLIELLVTIVIARILATIGILSITQIIKNSRFKTNMININMFLNSLNYARSEAVKRNNTVFDERNLGFSQSWDNGWNDFINVNDNSEYNAGVDTLLKTYPALTWFYIKNWNILWRSGFFLTIRIDC